MSVKHKLSSTDILQLKSHIGRPFTTREGVKQMNDDEWNIRWPLTNSVKCNVLSNVYTIEFSLIMSARKIPRPRSPAHTVTKSCTAKGDDPLSRSSRGTKR